MANSNDLKNDPRYFCIGSATAETPLVQLLSLDRNAAIAGRRRAFRGDDDDEDALPLDCSKDSQGVVFWD